MAQIIDLPTAAQHYIISIASWREPYYSIDHGKKETVIYIEASSWQEAEQLRDKAAEAIKKERHNCRS